MEVYVVLDRYRFLRVATDQEEGSSLSNSSRHRVEGMARP